MRKHEAVFLRERRGTNVEDKSRLPVRTGGVSLLRNLVDPASSHMLVSKTKPCMSKYSDIQRNCEWLIKTVIVYMIIEFTWITVVILELIHAGVPDFCGRAVFIR